MKTSILAIAITVASFSISSCNNSKTGENTQTSGSTSSKSTENSTLSGNASVKAIVANYMELTDALAGDNGEKAAQSGNKLEQTFKTFDKASLSEDQKKTFDDIADDATEHAEHIGKNAADIAHQREHFEMLSQDVYDLVKAISPGKKLYQAHCPMYNNNKGGNWLTTSKEIKNPYMGSKMPGCGTIKEEL